MKVTIILYVVGFFLAVRLLAWRFGGKGASTHGSSLWCPVWLAFRRGLFRRQGLRVGSWAGRLNVHHDATHAITFGAAGAGKGVSAIVPNLLRLRAGFVIDPGGENAAVAAKGLRKRGVAVGCINVFGMFSEAPASLPQHGFNPFDFLHPEHPTFAADALVFAEMLTPRAGNEGGSSAYFKDAAQRIKRALIVHIKTSAAIEKQSLATLYEAVNGDAQSWANLLASMKANPACGGLVAQEANVLERIESQASEEFSAIMSTIQQDLSFLADPAKPFTVASVHADGDEMKVEVRQESMNLFRLTPPRKSVAASELDTTGWRCPHCGCADYVIACQSCGTTVCGGRTVSGPGRTEVFHCRASCGAHGSLTDSTVVHGVDGARKAAPQLGAPSSRTPALPPADRLRLKGPK